ncbi:MAG: hypothetical protein UX13_C0044G0011 [Candidatus Woesebacteria bacterium GW2011_GWB1_45_5]|uniref:Uncharacterized protein n=1 Tax=Candidatus Woesebacteria bacterium GW2011_GWB1_45_5 TaxID=1618581 RepID=A0A0G1MMG6_9BACT|nr:MAG: hypothetical protein UX13_C0044G0011 [Candidatus Woesebacteria bacterium GW2011_GWB1_45_5]
METDPQKLRQIRKGLVKPDGISDGSFGHAAGLLNTLAENYQFLSQEAGNQERIQRLIARIKEEVQSGILPQETLDLLGYEEEPTDWRE